MTIPTIRASSAHRIALCPGSARAAWGIVSPDTDASQRGTRIHAWLASMAKQAYTPELTAEEREAATTMWDTVKDMIYTRMAEVEKPLEWAGWTGTPDLVLWDSDSTTIIDYKSGWGDIPEAAGNAQLRVYAMLAQDSPVEAIIVTPRGIHSKTVYEQEDIENASKELANIRNAALSPNAPRIPHPEACHWCPAFGTPACPETCKALEQADERMPAVSLGSLAPAEMGQIAHAWAIIRKRGQQVEDEIRRRLEEGQDVPGAKLKAGGVTRTIPDPQAAYNLVPDIPQAVFLKACSLSLNKLADAVYADSDDENATKIGVKRWLEDRLSPVIEEKERRAGLVIGGTEEP